SARKQQGARVIVDAIAMGAVCYAMDGVLEQARIIAEREKMPDPQLRNNRRLAPSYDRSYRKRKSRSSALARSLQDRKIALDGFRPRHRSAGRVRAFAHGMTADVVRQQASDLRAHSFGIPKGNQNAAPLD